MLRDTQHDRFVAEDYQRLRSMRICTARETIRWPVMEGGRDAFDLSAVEPYVAAANEHRIEVVWDLMHYGWPDWLDLFSAEFVTRFAAFCRVVAEYLRRRVDGARFYVPINEISFLAWAAGEVGCFYPFSRHRGGEVKRQLVRAWIAGVDAIRQIDPAAQIMAVEPLIHVVPAGDGDECRHLAAVENESQWEACDMLTGRLEPELGGHPRSIDVMGVNFYHDNQWEVPGGRKLAWHLNPRDRRWVPFSRLIRGAYDRYRYPIVVGETSHVGAGRATWLQELTDELLIAIDDGLPLEGICLYPIIDRFDWDDRSHWHNSGLWDYATEPDGTLRRVLNQAYALEFERSRRRLGSRGFS